LPRSTLRAIQREYFGAGAEHLSPAQLPHPGRKPSTTKDKLLVVVAVQHGLLTLAEACERYSLNLEEFLSWQRSIDEVWLSRTTKGGRYRQ
jgi:hypothetical protein